LVTGAGGFIGSHLAERLVEGGCRVRAFVHYRGDGSWGWLGSPRSRDMEIVSGDVVDRDSVSAAMKGIDVVFHLAALIGIPYSYVAPASYAATNVVGTLNILQAARDGGVRVILTSTSEVYGSARQVPIDETHPLQAQSPYAASKIAADKFGESYFHAFGAPVGIVRPFNTYGPRQSLRAVIPTIAIQALKGDTIRLGNLDPTRDFNYVSDTVEAFVKAAESEAAIGKTIHFGSGAEIAIRDLVARIGRILGKELHVEEGEGRARKAGSEVERLIANSAQAHAVLGWRPQIALDEGLRLTIDWLKAHSGEYRSDRYAV
jgi:dTDP-glucose 4,6-dehydratase